MLFRPAFADFSAADSSNLADIKSGLLADSGNGSFVSEGLTAFYSMNRRISEWGGNFIKTVGDASRRFVREFSTDGWFTAVKAYIDVIKADVGRIHTQMQDVNDHLEIIEGDVSSVKDNTESINTSVESIDDSVTSIKATTDNISTNVVDISDTLSGWYDEWTSFADIFDRDFNVPSYGFTRLVINPNPSNANSSFRAPTFAETTVDPQSVSGLGDMLNLNFYRSHWQSYYIQRLLASLVDRTWQNQNSLWATTNQLQKIYKRIPTNLVVNVSSANTNDWHHDLTCTRVSSYILNNLTPSISRDVSESYPPSLPSLTGDFRKDVLLLLVHAEKVAASHSSVNMDILTNLQVVANSILTSGDRVENESNTLRQTNQQIVEEGQSHVNDLDSIHEVFDLEGNNENVKDVSSTLKNLPSELSSLDVKEVPTSGTLTIPSFSFGDGGFHELQVNVDYSEYLPYFEAVRRVFAVFWFGLVVFILLVFLKFGILLLGRIASYIDPRPFLNNVQSANAQYL